MKFNINDYVKVRLTQAGKDILRKKSDEQHKRMPQVFKEFSLPKEDSDGWSEWQMWHLFSGFGEHIHITCDPPFETEIDIIEKQ